ncbi:MAG: U32 family peptidase [Solobacterium sp.]|nr:U32 family peptidase [Solobacterium sp.]
MRQIRAGVSDIRQAEGVLKAGGLPVFSAGNWAMNAETAFDLRETAVPFPFGVMMNRPVSESERDKFKDAVLLADRAGAEVIYFSDPALLRFADEALRRKCIYCPETLVTNSRDAAFWLNQGIGGVSVSPLLTREETAEIIHNVPHAEITIHGHMLLSVSRRRLLSAWRDHYGIEFEPEGNRNLVLRETTRQEDMPVYENDVSTMIFSDYIFESFDVIRDLQEAETAFVSGSFLSSEALIEAVRIYNSIIHGNDETAAVRAYRENNAGCCGGYYEQKTIL